MSFTLFPGTRLALALESLAGLSVGDALGASSLADISDDPPAPWEWTDDTEQACCLVAVLAEGDFDRDRFADLLARHHDTDRGYGAGAMLMLREIRDGLPWPIAAAAAFDGQGSAGNGAAMRAAPLGAWHADSLVHAAVQGARAAEVTHAHAEGIAGGVAVTVAAAAAAAGRLDGDKPDLLRVVASHTPAGRIRDDLIAATRVRSAAEAAYEFGSGARAMARDTVPFAIWVANRFLGDYPGAIAACIAAGGDIDTTCAIAGGIVAAYTGLDGIPPAWLSAREPLPGWLAAATAAGE
ncbi:ADP-ribosylglycohydrolase [Actinoplanes tereljensis]|uniref:Hydrolase n=1 Tax=Paractinoplanes tereljensis TaxID=571912 RepID=A0A919NFK3_9ACTN|nr:ADP-ribosylglycohydrolase family protein [Actinoplanes tereljensis]GIF17543.1 hydrolase [Actinoplanes tereljensis]